MNLVDPDCATEFNTEHLSIRRCEPKYAEALTEAAIESVSEIYPFLPWCHPNYELSDAEQWLEFAAKQWADQLSYAFSIFSKSSGDLLGGCGVSRIDQHPVANLGYWVRSSATGRNIATEATAGLVRFAFQELGLQRIEVIMATHNEASRRVAIKSGATFEGTLRSRLELHDELYDAYLYSHITAKSRKNDAY